jgi:hypothetical protein
MGFNSAHSSEEMRIASSGPLPYVRSTDHFTCHYQGVSHAEWPKYKH